MQYRPVTLFIVMPGLDPGIQGCGTMIVRLALDRRVKPGDDK